MHLLVGLGNPGDDHRNNRHNIGFLAADAIAARHGFGPWKQKFQGLIAEGSLCGEKALLQSLNYIMPGERRTAALPAPIQWKSQSGNPCPCHLPEYVA